MKWFGSWFCFAVIFLILGISFNYWGHRVTGWHDFVSTACFVVSLVLFVIAWFLYSAESKRKAEDPSPEGPDGGPEEEEQPQS